ncbi:MAG: DNA recombination protein RmuC [Ignavibacteriae bacterium]|nr:DNA recombination protein RmuC [Ignavibacteria bacterium]MBI3365316.1 DNA recombination protein RmuC [Ignavibacteriota bacterium]
MDIITLLIGLVIGASSAFFIFKFKFERDRGVPKDQFDELASQIASLTTEKGKAEERATFFESTLNRTNQELSGERTKFVELSTALATAQADLKNANQKLQDQKDELQQIQSQFTAEFKNLANDILEEKSRKFTELNKDNLTTILNPLEQKIKDFQVTINDTYGKESNERTALAEQIRHLTDLNQQMTKEASNLTTALRGQSKTQGDWGEFVLEQILEGSGLVKGTHYVVQQVMQGQDGKTQKPDVVVNLPDNKHIVIDSKVSLVAFTDYCNAEDVDSQQALLSDHLTSIRKHIKELSEKNYQNIYQLQSVDFVLMFINVEPAFIVAARNDKHLYNDAFEKNIVIVCASTLMATLRTIASIWRRENQTKNAIEIARKSGELYDKFVGFLEDLKSVGDKLQACQKSYDDAFGKLKTGRRNIIERAEELKEMGAKTSKALPATLIEKALESEQLPNGKERNPE